ncbi:hypothetical protein HK098_007710 [Nowakowskiella sp. JEL0407]|nr:hypothetical protein HK098_007710 [Nowakowskiella sp. JEL0407]
MYFDEFAKRIIPVQHRIFYVVLAFGRFNLYALSVSYLLKRLFTTPVDQNKKPVTARQYREDVVLELVALGLFWGWYGFVLWSLPSWGWVLGYFLVSNMMTGLLHVQITISHFGMPAVTLNGEEFARMGLNSSMDVECPRWLDWFHGGLQFQVIHHLFPRIPRHRLRSIKPMVIKLAQDNGLVYHSHEFVKSNKIVLGVLKEVADQVGFLVEAAPSCLSEGH